MAVILSQALSASGVTGPIFADSSVVIAWDGSNGFGDTGPTLDLFDDFRNGTNGAVIPLSSPQIGTWTGRGTNLQDPTYSTEFARSFASCFRGRNFPKYDPTLSAPFISSFEHSFTASSEFFMSYAFRTPEYWPGGTSPQDTFYDGSNYKGPWISDDFGKAAEGKTDIVLPSKASQQASEAQFKITGNDGNIVYDGDAEGRIAPTVNGWGKASEWYDFGGWQRMSFWFKAGADADVDPGDVWGQVVTPGRGTNRAFSSSGNPAFNGSNTEIVDSLSIPGFIRDDSPLSHDDCRPLYDDFYLAIGAGSAARVEIGNNATYANCTDLALATLTAHSNEEIACTLREGAFPTFAGLHIFITDKNNAQVGASRLIS